MIAKVDCEKGGKRWIIKKKFTFGGISLVVGWVMTFMLMARLPEAITAADIASILGALGTFTLVIIAPLFASDVADKMQSGEKYDVGSS